MVTVGQSVIWAMVMILSLCSPLHESVVGEGTSSLNTHQSHCHCHLTYSIPMVGHRLLTCLCLLSLCFQDGVCEVDEDPWSGL